MEMTTENKAKFFAQYWGKSFINGINGESVLSFIDINDISLGRITGKLMLKPLSSISDEDADEYLRLTGIQEFHRTIYLDSCKKLLQDDYDDIFRTDFLRSKGYALPWMGLSVDQMVEAGWIKLQEA